MLSVSVQRFRIRLKKGKITITGVNSDFLNVVRGKMMKDLLYVRIAVIFHVAHLFHFLSKEKQPLGKVLQNN